MFNLNRKLNSYREKDLRIFLDWGERLIVVKIFQGKEFRIVDEKFKDSDEKNFRIFLKNNFKVLDLFLKTHYLQMELKSFEGLN